MFANALCGQFRVRVDTEERARKNAEELMANVARELRDWLHRAQ